MSHMFTSEREREGKLQRGRHPRETKGNGEGDEISREGRKNSPKGELLP